MKAILVNFLCIVGAYFIGSIPIGFMVAQLQNIDDITKKGSGNIGATNVARCLGTPYFFLVLVLDAAKAYFVVKLLMIYGFSMALCVVASICILIGNGYSVFLYGRGGKGIATSLGIFLAIVPDAIISLLIIWLITLLYTRTVGIASVLTLCFVPWSVYILHGMSMIFGLSMFVAVWGLLKHRPNIEYYFATVSSQSL